MAGFETWTTSETQTEDGLLSIRNRAALPPPMKRAKLPHLILIGWGYEPDGEGGMPTAAELKQMAAFEAAVEKALDADGAGFPVASITGEGAREWRYYAADPDAFMDALNDALDGHPEYPIEFVAYDDPEWDALAELIED